MTIIKFISDTPYFLMSLSLPQSIINESSHINFRSFLLQKELTTRTTIMKSPQRVFFILWRSYFSQQLLTMFTSSFHLKIFWILWNFLWLYIYTIINKVNYGWLNIKNRCFLKYEKNTWIQTMTNNFLALQTVSVQCWLIFHQKPETPLVTKEALRNSVRTANHVWKCSADPFNKP